MMRSYIIIKDSLKKGERDLVFFVPRAHIMCSAYVMIYAWKQYGCNVAFNVL